MSRGHRWEPLGRGTGLTWCPACGLVYLKNWISQLCARLGCDYPDSEPYRSWVRRGRPAVVPADE